MIVAEVRTIRRFYRLKLAEAVRLEDLGLADVWRGKLAATSGTALPSDLPGLEELAALDPPITLLEDLDGADVDELVALGVDRSLATEILEALAELDE